MTPPPLSPGDAVSLAAERMWRFEVPVLPVVDERDRYVGVVSIFSLLRRRVPGSTKVKSVLERAPPVSDVSDPFQVAQKLVRTGLPGLAVVRNGRVEGVVSARRVVSAMGLRAAASARLMMYPLEPLMPEDSIEKARKLMAGVGLRIAPVASEGRLEGVLLVYDLVNYIYSTPVRRDRRGEVKGDVEYFLDQPVRKVMHPAERVVEADKSPSLQDLAEGAVVVGSSGKVVGIISPYLLLRRLLPAFREAGLPVRVEGVSELDFISQRLIYRKVWDIARSVHERGRLLELSLVVKPREKAGGRRRYDAYASVKLDVGVHSGKASSWDPVEAAYEALDIAYRSFSKLKRKKREERVRAARRRKWLGS